jgi:NAD(P)-dependent dehydrogenase (short-subunit alcohol dehydrogenase family)
MAKPFTQFTADDFRSLSSTNLDGFFHVTQRVIGQLLEQKRGGSVVSITSSLTDNPIVGLPASVPMITKGGINAISRNLAMEYARQGIRVNTVSPGVVDTPLLKGVPKDFWSLCRRWHRSARPGTLPTPCCFSRRHRE